MTLGGLRVALFHGGTDLIALAEGCPNQHQWVLRHNPKQQNLLHYASQPLGQRFFYNQTFPPNPYSFGVREGVAAQLFLFPTRAHKSQNGCYRALTCAVAPQHVYDGAIVPWLSKLCLSASLIVQA